MNVLITGASGSAGYYLAQYIRKRSKKIIITGLGRSSEPGEVAEYLSSYHSVDLFRVYQNRLNDIIERIRPDYVFHLAANAHVRDSFNNPGAFVNANITGTTALFEALARLKKKPRVLLASTSEVYGNVPKMLNPIKEDYLMAPVNPYAVTKCAQEHLASYYGAAYGIDFVITRAFGYINPRRADLVATSLAQQVVDYERKKIESVEHGDLRPVRSFCDVRDIAKAYWLTARNATAHGIYNIGSRRSCSILDLFGLILGQTGHSVGCTKRDSLLRPTDIFYCVPNTMRFIREMNWEPKIALEDSIEWLVKTLRKAK